MAEAALPHFPVTANSRVGSAQADAEVQIPRKIIANGRGVGRPQSAETNDASSTSVRSYPSKLISTFGSGQTNNALGKSASAEGRRDSQAIDPLSNAILKRTSTQGLLSPKMRPAPSEKDSVTTEPVPSIASARTSSEPSIARAENVAGVPKDKRRPMSKADKFFMSRNKASFFSRFVAPKKKDAPSEIVEKEAEVGDQRTEGMDAHVFSQPIGYVPQFPPPPKYIRVRSHAKKAKDFNRLFLAQELKGKTGVEIAQNGGRRVKSEGLDCADPRKDSNAIWAMEFSSDGKHLASGGKDFVVRVWAVLSTKEDRRAHETEEDAGGQGGQNVRLNAPVFKKTTVQEYAGHTASVLDLSWSKNNFLLSSSMDKTVRLWHISRAECLCCFKHSDFVTSIQFHPRDDRFFLAGSLDSKLRLWSIPDKSVAYWNTLPDLITAVAFSPDGKTAMAGCLNGLCLVYETEGLKYQNQVHVRSAHGKNAKGSKVTGMQAMNFPPDDPAGEVKILITSNDSRVRVYNLRDKSLELKLKGNENSCSQIHATFSDDGKYIICGSEDKKAYIWSTGPSETEKDKRPVEMFEATPAICTSAIIAPTRTRQLLSTSGDPLYDLCNPPPVTLISRTESRTSSVRHTDEAASSLPPTPATADFTKTTKPEESPAYLARCAHPDGNIVVTADYMGHIKVFRQDCAYQNRLRSHDSALSRKMLGRTNSVATKNSNRSSRHSLQHNHSSDRILSWRQSINSTNASLDSFRNPAPQRSLSPRKSLGQVSLQSTRHYSQPASITPPSVQEHSPQHSPPRRSPEGPTAQAHNPSTDTSRKPYQALPRLDKEDPLMLQGDQSYMFWNSAQYQAQAASSHLDPHNIRDAHLNGYSANSSTAGSSNASANGRDHLGPPIAKEMTNVSRLSSEDNSEDEVYESPDPGEGGEMVCRRCGGTSFRVKTRLEHGKEHCHVCQKCGQAV